MRGRSVVAAVVATGLLGLEGGAAGTPLARWLVRPASFLVERDSGLPLARPVPVEPLTPDEARARLSAELRRDAEGQDLDAQARVVLHGLGDVVQDQQRAVLQHGLVVGEVQRLLELQAVLDQDHALVGGLGRPLASRRHKVASAPGSARAPGRLDVAGRGGDGP